VSRSRGLGRSFPSTSPVSQWITVAFWRKGDKNSGVVLGRKEGAQERTFAHPSDRSFVRSPVQPLSAARRVDSKGETVSVEPGSPFPQ
jgi:hypothetical protein